MKGIKAGLIAAAASATLAFGGTDARAGEEITVTHWGVLMYGVPYAVAMEKGYFEEAGVEIDGILTSSGGATTVRNVITGGLIYGETSLAAAVAAHLGGQDVVIVNSAVGTVADLLWVTMPDRDDINSIEDLAGKRVAYTRPQSVTEMVLRLSLDGVGLSDEEVELIAAGGIGDGLTMLTQGALDAVPILKPLWSARRDEFKQVFHVADTLPRMTQTVGITTSRALEEQPDALRAIIEGRRKGVQFTYENPKEAAEIVARAYEQEPEMFEIAVQNMADIEYWVEGAFDYEEMDRKVEGLKLVDVLEEDVNWDEFVDDSLLPEDLRN